MILGLGVQLQRQRIRYLDQRKHKRPGSPGLKAGVPGLEPRTKESESSVLPITPYPTEPAETGPTSNSNVPPQRQPKQPRQRAGSLVTVTTVHPDACVHFTETVLGTPSARPVPTVRE